MTECQKRTRRRLAAALKAAMAQATSSEMQWGKDDCALWHGSIELQARGYDPCAVFRGRYRTRRGAHRVLGKGGLPAAMRRLARQYRWRKINPAEAEVGDIGLMSLPDSSIAVVRMLYKDEWIGRNEFGWSMVPTERVRLAWSVC